MEMQHQFEMPPEKSRILQYAAGSLATVPGIVAVVLGGSYASGMARSNSDIDIGLYYREASPFSVAEVRAVAERISDPGAEPVVTGFYEWGPWVNGGAWVETPAGKVDFVYRNLDQVQNVIDEGDRGVWRHDFDQQPPYGFRSTVYFGELRICVPVHDPDGEIARLKRRVALYPEPLRNRIVQESLWGAEFSLLTAHGFASNSDVVNVVGCMTRASQFLVHALFALNRQYLVSEKRLDKWIDAFVLHPPGFASRLADVLASPGRNSSELKSSILGLHALWLEIVALTAGSYTPRWGAAARAKLTP